MLATGYNYDFSFLDPACGIVVKPDKVVSPVYQHMVNIEHPTMMLLGLPWTVRRGGTDRIWAETEAALVFLHRVAHVDLSCPPGRALSPL